VRADALNATVQSWLDTQLREPFFLYVHATDPHAPYMPPPPWDARFRDPAIPPLLPDSPNPVRVVEKQPALATPANIAWLTNQYDGEIAFTDDAFGALMASLDRLGVRDRTIVVVTADHGEEFKDHGGFEHGMTVYRELTHVPLILRLSGDAPAGRRVPALVRQIDILPTLLDYTGVPVPDGVDGRSLRPLVAGDEPPAAPEAFTETRLGDQELAALVTPSWKVISRSGRRGPRVEVYDLAADPGEQRNLASGEAILAGYGTHALARWAATAPRPSRGSGAGSNEPRITPELRERLRALGYVN
jgi:arylsulfatase A-like enzyme